MIAAVKFVGNRPEKQSADADEKNCGIDNKNDIGQSRARIDNPQSNTQERKEISGEQQIPQPRRIPGISRFVLFRIFHDPAICTALFFASTILSTG